MDKEIKEYIDRLLESKQNVSNWMLGNVLTDLFKRIVYLEHEVRMLKDNNT